MYFVYKQPLFLLTHIQKYNCLILYYAKEVLDDMLKDKITWLFSGPPIAYYSRPE